MKLAHLILAHKDPQLLGRLVKRLHHENSDVYIQLDKKANIDDFIHLEAIGNTYFIENRVITEWGNYSIIKATLNGFEQILRAGIKYSHINLISGQDYPLKPIEQIQQFLFANTDKTFMHSLSIGDNEWDNGKMRVAKYSFGDYDFPGKYQLQAIVNAVMPNRKLPQKLKPYGRSQWLTITPLCAQYAINYLKNNPKVERFFRMTWAIDELFLSNHHNEFAPEKHRN